MKITIPSWLVSSDKPKKKGKQKPETFMEKYGLGIIVFSVIILGLLFILTLS